MQTAQGKWYAMSIRAWRTLDNVVKGTVISFVDITETVAAREALNKASDRPTHQPYGSTGVSGEKRPNSLAVARTYTGSLALFKPV